MLKKILQASAIASVLAIGFVLPASAAVYSEEDAAAPVGSFTSDMAAPMSPRFHGAASGICPAYARTHDAPRGVGAEPTDGRALVHFRFSLNRENALASLFVAVPDGVA